MGDRVAHSIGVTCKAEVQSFYVKKNDKFIVIGSDGLWEFLENKEVGEIVYPYFNTSNPE